MGSGRRGRPPGPRALLGVAGLALLVALVAGPAGALASPAVGNESTPAPRPSTALPLPGNLPGSGAHVTVTTGTVAVRDAQSGSSATLRFGGPAYSAVPSGSGSTPLAGASIAYDPALSAFVAFGGQNDSSNGTVTYSNETLVLDGGVWQSTCPASAERTTCAAPPPARSGALLLYDPTTGSLLLTGGRGSGGGGFADLWSYGEGGWSDLTTAAPPPGLWNGQWAYDSEGGFVLAVTDSGSTYRYLGGAWSALNLTVDRAALGRTYAAMFDDPSLGGVVLYGGFNTHNRTLNDTWLFRYGAWEHETEAGAPGASGLEAKSTPLGPIDAAYDTNLDLGLLFDPTETGTNATWWLENASWRNATSEVAGTPTPGRGASAFAWDPIDGIGLLTVGNRAGSFETSYYFSDALTVALGNSRAAIDVGQSATFSPQLSQGLPPYTTKLLGEAPGCSLSSTTSAYPQLRCSESSAAELNLTLRFSDGARRGGPVTYELLVHLDPTLNLSKESPDPTSAGVPVSFGATAAQGTLPYDTLVWSFDGGPAVSVESPSFAFRTAGNHTFTVELTDAAGYSVRIDGSIHVNPDPGVVLFTNRSATDAGLPLALRAEVSGGTGAVGCAWNFGGAGTSDSCDPVTAFASAGAHQVRFWANDSVGAVQESNLTLVIAPLVTVALGGASASSVAGASVDFRSTTAYGIAPYTVNWSFGDGGTAQGSEVSHSYGIPGTYNATVVVTDAVGGRAVATEVVEVGASGPAGNGTGTGPGEPSNPGGSLDLPRSAAGPSAAYVIPGGLVEVALAIALAGLWMIFERRARERGGPSVGWLRRAAQRLRDLRRGDR